MKKRFQKVFAFLGIFALLISNPATILYVDALSAADAKESVEVGSLTNEGDIHIEKTATPTQTPGRYKITFKIKGVPYTTTNPLYAAVVFDRSGFMICSNGGAAQDNNHPHYTAADGTGVSCYRETWGGYEKDIDLLTDKKWENAISGAQIFQSTIKANLGDSAHVSLVTFSSNAEEATNSFDAASFKSPLGRTNLADAINAAKTKLDSDAAGDTNAKKVILVISDGSPTEPTGSWLNPKDPVTEAQNAASRAINSGIEIYAIGYQTDDIATSTLRDKIATDAAHYSNADPDTIAAAVQEMVNDLVAAAIDPTLTDTATPEFKMVGGDAFGGTKTFTLENITGDEQTVSFEVDIDQSLPTGLYDTNNTTDSKAGITYKDPKTGETKTLMLDESPSVYWERPSYSYTVNHYKDSLGGEKVEPSDTGEAEYTTEIPYETRTIKGYKFDHLEDKDGNVVNSVSITDIPANNVLNVIYTKKDDLEYKVVYHYEDVNGEFTETIEDDGNPHTATFGDSIDVDHYKEVGLSKKEEGTFVYNSHILNPESGTIDDEEENTLDIFYTRKKYDYCVKYFYNDVEDTSKKVEGTDRYGKMISYEDKNKEGYKFLKVLPSASITISKDKSQNEIDVYYVKDDFEYTVNYYKDEIAGDPFKTENESAEFESTIPYDNTPPAGYKFDHAEGQETVTANSEDNVLNVLFVKDDFEYTVNYYKDEISGEPFKSDNDSAEYESTIPYDNTPPTGYKFDHAEGQTTVTEKSEDNVLNVLFVKDDYEYTVEYYKDSFDNEAYKTENDSAEYESTIPYDNTPPAGYKFSKVEGQETVTEDSEKNVLKVLFVKDDFEYTVNYYKDAIAGDPYKTENESAEYESTIPYDNTPPEGYKFDHAEGQTTVTEKSEDNVLNVLFVKDEFDYCVKYFYDNQEDTSKKVEGKKLFGDMLTYEDKNKPGYKFLKVEPSETITISTGTNEIDVYYVKDNIEYTVNYYKDEISGDPYKTENDSAEFESTIPYDNTPPAGYKFDHAEGQETVTANSEDNVLNVLFVKDDFEYTVNYYKDEISGDPFKSENDSAEYDSTIPYDQTPPTGYKFDHAEGQTTVTEKSEDNVLNVLFVKDDYEYTVEYYKDSFNNEAYKTENNSAEYESTIPYDNTPPTGYKFSKVEGQKTVTEDSEKNILKVLFIKDEFEYTVEYYKDSFDTEAYKTDNDSAEYESTIPYDNTPPTGYKFSKVEGQETVTEDSEKNILKVLFVKDDFEYTVNYYKDEIAGNPFKSDNESAEFESDIPYDKTPPKGYKFVHVEDKDGNVVEGLSVTENPDNNILNVLFERDIYDYQIDYYYDENKDDSKTEYGQAAYQTTINGYPDKVIEGYTLDREENLPLTIDTKDNLINVFYAKRTDLSYVVQYYYDGVLDEDATVYYVNQTFGDKITKYIDKAKDGYTLDRVENLPLTISVDKDKNIIKVYYVNTAKDEPIEIPNTSTTHSSSNGGELLLFSILGLEVILRRKKAGKRLS